MPTTFLDVMLSQLGDVGRIRRLERTVGVSFVTVLTIAAAQVSVPLPFTPVPFTFQPMIVLVGGAALGSRLGAASQIAYLALGCAGLPVFAASPALPQGIARLMGPTGGYLMAYPLAAFVAGWLAERGFDRRYVTAVLAMLCGLALVYAGGVSWLALTQTFDRASGWTPALGAGLFPFVLPDCMKVLLAGAVMPSLWQLIFPEARRG
jgi:biotin transport system substrate-specific component